MHKDRNKETRGRGNYGRREQHQEAGRLGGLARARNLRSKKSGQRRNHETAEK